MRKIKYHKRQKIDKNYYINKEYIEKIKDGGRCEFCGEKNKICLEFHHRDKNSKLFDVCSEKHKYSLEEIKREIDKCYLLCRNCHMKVHYEERGDRHLEDGVLEELILDIDKKIYGEEGGMGRNKKRD